MGMHVARPSSWGALSCGSTESVRQVRQCICRDREPYCCPWCRATDDGRGPDEILEAAAVVVQQAAAAVLGGGSATPDAAVGRSFKLKVCLSIIHPCACPGNSLRCPVPITLYSGSQCACSLHANLHVVHAVPGGRQPPALTVGHWEANDRITALANHNILIQPVVSVHLQAVPGGRQPPALTVGRSCVYICVRDDGFVYCGQTDDMRSEFSCAHPEHPSEG